MRTVRPGFSLFEVVIASGLMVFLLATMLSAIRYVYAAEAVSQDELLLFRTGSGLLDAMQRDLDAAVRMIDPSQSSDTSDLLDTADGTDLGAAATEVTIDPALSMMRDRIAGAGDLLVSIVQTQRPGELPAATDAAPLSLSQRHGRVWWHLGEDGGLARDVQTTDAGGEWITLDSATDTTTTGFVVSFFDGAGWTDSWDGVAAGVDPVAVEVMLTLAVEGSSKSITMSRVMPVAAGRFAVPATDDAALDTLPMLELGL